MLTQLTFTEKSPTSCNFPSPCFTVLTKPSRGRCAISCDDVIGGQVVHHDENAAVAVVHHGNTNRVCGYCFGMVPSDRTLTVACPSCHAIYYCDAQCQRLDMSLHHSPVVCSLYAQLVSSYPNLDPELLTQARILIQCYAKQVQHKTVFDLVMTLSCAGLTVSSEEETLCQQLHTCVEQACIKAIQIQPQQPQQLQQLQQPPNHPEADADASIASVLTQIQANMSMELTRTLYLKDRANGFALLAAQDADVTSELKRDDDDKEEEDEEEEEDDDDDDDNDEDPPARQARGYALFPSSAVFNHCCMPNLCRFDMLDARDGEMAEAEPKAEAEFTATAAATATATITPAPAPRRPVHIQFRALHDIPAGQELMISYVPLGIPVDLRQARMKSEYGFTCRCERCLEEEQEQEQERAQEREQEREQDEDEDEEQTPAPNVTVSSSHAKHHHPSQHHKHHEDKSACDVDHHDSDQGAGGGAGAITSDTASVLPIFMIKYICANKRCGGTLCPVVPGSLCDGCDCSGCAACDMNDGLMECNMCGAQRTNQQFFNTLEEILGQHQHTDDDDDKHDDDDDHEEKDT